MPIGSWRKLAEEKISQAARRGEFDNLPNAGQPLNLQDESGVPDELRMAYKMLKNSGFTPPELETRKEIMQMEDLLANAPDEKARYQALKRLNYLTMKLGEMRPNSGMFDNPAYADRIAEKISKK